MGITQCYIFFLKNRDDIHDEKKQQKFSYNF